MDAKERSALAASLKDFTYAEFEAMRREWLSSGRMVWFAYGNLARDAAVAIVEKCRSALPLTPVARAALQHCPAVELPEMENSNLRLDFPVVDEANENSVLVSYFQVGLEGRDSRVRLLNQIAMHYMDEPTFNQLRTIEQLGYVVFTRATQVRDVVGA